MKGRRRQTGRFETGINSPDENPARLMGCRKGRRNETGKFENLYQRSQSLLRRNPVRLFVLAVTGQKSRKIGGEKHERAYKELFQGSRRILRRNVRPHESSLNLSGQGGDREMEFFELFNVNETIYMD